MNSGLIFMVKLSTLTVLSRQDRNEIELQILDPSHPLLYPPDLARSGPQDTVDAAQTVTSTDVPELVVTHRRQLHRHPPRLHRPRQ